MQQLCSVVEAGVPNTGIVFGVKVRQIVGRARHGRVAAHWFLENGLKIVKHGLTNPSGFSSGYSKLRNFMPPDPQTFNTLNTKP